MEAESFGAMPDFAPQDSLRGLASVDVQKDFPELEYVPLSERHSIEVDVGEKKELEAQTEEKSSMSTALPFLGVIFVFGVASTFIIRNATN